ncbi:uncharacterized protein LOC110044244 isoform X2 [Orbicella faveolata]|uniref:uncharacterized protein LOC110044244 isoform X2 n=1 Tax=Orbicella faveolata TaxID=48498 RepID=UPI0009E502C7|nr:uncharacterized protein LOC110044244 isoform X2 [Orbicella faveolata]
MEEINNAVEDGFNTNPGKESSKRVHLFNCDKTYNLDLVEKLFCDIGKKLSFDIQLPIGKSYFPMPKMSEMCETTIPKLQMDVAIFVVHAHESRLSINEDNAGIGYAKIYRALLKATDENVLIVIGGDDQYSNTNEEERSVISRWARGKISSQFKEEFMDGRRSFIFSWNKKHRAIHEEALLHYFDPCKKGQKFEYQPRISPEVSTEGKENESENKKMPGEGDDRYQEQEVEHNADRHAESSSGVEKNREAPGTLITPKQRPDVEDDKGMPEEETQPHSLPADYVYIPETSKDEFEVVEISEVETLLLKTRLRYGQLSDRDDDKMVRNEQWTPPGELLSSISDRFKDVAEADLEIYRMEESGVIRVKITDTTKKPFIYAIIEVVSSVITWIIDNTWQIIQWARGSEAVVAGQSEEGYTED